MDEPSFAPLQAVSKRTMIATMNADEFRSHGQMQVLEPTQSAIGRKVIWSHPAYANKTAYIRNDRELVAVDLSAED